ncbi:TolC family protein [Breoghania sp.]|uniref:TolC family protein n=1 Tax=Breoghania sp. TaxID=2065378 RepID=UPI0026293250|nr:TolC family protein [Breoghania sp.]MDJ0930779.1 TolC family protein [Breoghania sp.]
MTIRTSAVALAAASTVFFFAAGAQQAQSISDAPAMAYSNNPSLNAARAQLHATNEGVNQALSSWRPQIFANLSAGHTSYSFKPGGELYYNTATVGLRIQQAVFRGFRTVTALGRQKPSSRLRAPR